MWRSSSAAQTTQLTVVGFLKLQELGLNYSSSGTGSGRLSSAGGATPAGLNSSSSSSRGSSLSAAAVEAQVDAAMAVLYRLLGPLALACVPALEAVAAFLHYLTVDDGGYG